MVPLLFVTRFAPSPNGELHLGHALSAITAFEMARRRRGRFLLRIEDIDTERSREDHVTQIFDDLRWLGITWEEPVWRQSRRFDVYRAATAGLRSLGLLYPCFCTRAQMEAGSAGNPLAVDPDGAPLYSGRCKTLTSAEVERRAGSGEPYSLRLDMARALPAVAGKQPGALLTFSEWSGDDKKPAEVIAAEPARWGDPVIVRKDTPTSYHLSVVLDDAAQGITHVVRGRDLYPATGLHRLLQALLSLPEPMYHHHPLVLDESGHKLSKSRRDTSLAALRAQGMSPADVRRRLMLPPP